MKTLTPAIKRRLEIQSFTETDPKILEKTVQWLGFPDGICTILAAVGTALASPVILLILKFFQHSFSAKRQKTILALYPRIFLFP